MKFQWMMVLIVVFVTTQAYNEEVERKLDTSGPRPILKGLHSFCAKYRTCYNNCPYDLKKDMIQLCSVYYSTIRRPKNSKREEGDERDDVEKSDLEEFLENLEEKIQDVYK